MDKIANNFYDCLISLGYRDEDDKKADIYEVSEDLAKMKEVVPRMYNLLREMSDQ